MLPLFLPATALSQSHALIFEKEIGVGWRTHENGWMSLVSFSPDGTMVASDASTKLDYASGDLTLWSFPDGRFIKHLPARPMAISRDWKYYACYNSVAKMETGEAVISLGKSAEVSAFSPDSRYVAELSYSQAARNSRIRIVELASGKQVSAFGTIAPNAIAISPDGVTLAAGYWDIVTLWNMFTGKRLAVFPGFDNYVGALSFSPDGKLLAAGAGGTLQIWDVRRLTRAESLDIGAGGAGLSAPEFSPDGRLIAVGVYGIGTAYLIDVGRGKIIDHQKVSDMGCGSVAFSPNGQFLITPSTGGLIKWPYDKGGTIRVFRINAP